MRRSNTTEATRADPLAKPGADPEKRLRLYSKMLCYARLRCYVVLCMLQKPNARMRAGYNEMEERGYGIKSTYVQ